MAPSLWVRLELYVSPGLELLLLTCDSGRINARQFFFEISPLVRQIGVGAILAVLVYLYA